MLVMTVKYVFSNMDSYVTILLISMLILRESKDYLVFKYGLYLTLRQISMLFKINKGSYIHKFKYGLLIKLRM
jgi:hypothetical protein